VYLQNEKSRKARASSNMQENASCLQSYWWTWSKGNLDACIPSALLIALSLMARGTETTLDLSTIVATRIAPPMRSMSECISMR